VTYDFTADRTRDVQLNSPSLFAVWHLVVTS
jgi:hypothetical protein